jgi:hypothetical protein
LEFDFPGLPAPFDYVVTMEDLRCGQRVANYSFEFQAVGSDVWEILVPPVIANKTPPAGVGDRPDGHDPRDQYLGRKRIDVPIVPTGGGAVQVAKVRFNCIRAIEDPVYLKSVELRQRRVPWEGAGAARGGGGGGGAPPQP